MFDDFIVSFFALVITTMLFMTITAAISYLMGLVSYHTIKKFIEWYKNIKKTLRGK